MNKPLPQTKNQTKKTTNPPSKSLLMLPWALVTVVALLAVGVWLQDYGTNLGQLTLYQVFPLLGLLAFSIMWSHYAVGAVRRFANIEPRHFAHYFKATSLLVLGAIVLHPGLLIWQLWRDGFGLPPQSYLANYIAPDLAWAAALGTISFTAFIAYDVCRRFRDRKWWKLVDVASDLAMLAIWVHAFNLGTQTQQGWFQLVWIFYGITLVLFLMGKWGLLDGNRAKKES